METIKFYKFFDIPPPCPSAQAQSPPGWAIRFAASGEASQPQFKPLDFPHASNYRMLHSRTDGCSASLSRRLDLAW
jgi:hypothetical protein